MRFNTERKRGLNMQLALSLCLY